MDVIIDRGVVGRAPCNISGSLYFVISISQSL